MLKIMVLHASQDSPEREGQEEIYMYIFIYNKYLYIHINIVYKHLRINMHI